MKREAFSLLLSSLDKKILPIANSGCLKHLINNRHPKSHIELKVTKCCSEKVSYWFIVSHLTRKRLVKVKYG